MSPLRQRGPALYRRFRLHRLLPPRHQRLPHPRRQRPGRQEHADGRSRGRARNRDRHVRRQFLALRHRRLRQRLGRHRHLPAADPAQRRPRRLAQPVVRGAKPQFRPGRHDRPRTILSDTRSAAATATPSTIISTAASTAASPRAADFQRDTHTYRATLGWRINPTAQHDRRRALRTRQSRHRASAACCR